MRLSLRLFSILLLSLFLTLPACDSNDEEDDPNSDIPADPDTPPPPAADGALIPSIALGEIDPDNPGRIPLVIGGVAYNSETGLARFPATSSARLGSSSTFTVVDYTDDNLFIVEDGVVQGKVISVGAEGLKSDIVFVIDNTSSMGDEITGVRASVLDFIEVLETAGQDVTAGVVAYNDNLNNPEFSGVPATDTRALPAVYGFVDLTTDFSTPGTLYQFIENLPPVGGGDGPELALGGIDYARRAFSWREGAQRVYILITDATTWGQGFPEPNSKGIDADYFSTETLADVLLEDGSVVHVYSPDLFFDPSPPEYDVRPLADLTGGIWNELNRSATFDLTDLGILETTLASARVEFVKEGDPSTTRPRTLRVVVRVEDDGRVFDGERTLTLSY